MRKHYVLGLVFNNIPLIGGASRILLIEKRRPPWQKGQWNGISGKIEGDEMPIEAMYRESEEETGHRYSFKHKITFVCPGGTVFVFAAIYRDIKIDFMQIEDERLCEWPLLSLPEGLIANMKWIIPLCLANVRFPVMIEQLCLGVDS